MGIPTLIKTQTASGSGSLAFVDGAASVVFDSTYDEYMFVLTDIHPSANTPKLYLKGSTDGGSSYGVTTTNTLFYAYQAEDDSGSGLSYDSGDDTAQATRDFALTRSSGNDNDQSCAGIVHIYSPSNTTYVKHVKYTMNDYHSSDYGNHVFGAGYWNTTSAIDAVQFLFNSGNIDVGTIQMYGIA